MIRELAQRNSSGDIVTVYWNALTETISLTVHRELPDECQLVVADIPSVPHDKVNDAFAHPFAYAAYIGSISLPDRSSTYATTEDDYPEDGGQDFDIDGYGTVTHDNDERWAD